MNYAQREQRKNEMKEKIKELKRKNREEENRLEMEMNAFLGEEALQGLNVDIEKIAIARNFIVFEQGLKNMKKSVVQEAIASMLKGAGDLTNKKRDWHGKYTYKRMGKIVFSIKLKPADNKEVTEEPFELTKKEKEAISYYLKELITNRSFYREEKKRELEREIID